MRSIAQRRCWSIVIAGTAGLALAASSVALAWSWLEPKLGWTGGVGMIDGDLAARLPGPVIMIGLVALLAVSLVGIGVVIGVEGFRTAAPPPASVASEPGSLTLRLEATGLSIDCEAAAVLKLIRDYLETNEAYATSLAKAGRNLPAMADSDQVRKVVQALMADNSKMQKDTSELRASLEQSQSQIEALRADLADAREIGLRDGLTEVGNRRAFDLTLASEIETAHAQGASMCLVMGDIDHFKKINDAFGHVVGDEVLKVFAKVLEGCVQGEGSVSRYGGEEFAIILPATKLETAKQLTECIRGELEGKRLVANDCGRPVGEITASFGIAELVDGDDPARIIQRADDKLFEAKNAGRNRVAHDGKRAA
jgi:diguanylate cyclase